MNKSYLVKNSNLRMKRKTRQTNKQNFNQKRGVLQVFHLMPKEQHEFLVTNQTSFNLRVKH